jgi:protein-tyrosine phosphatase
MTSHDPYRVCFVCSGNICRSPMGEVVLRALADDAGVGERLRVASAGTGDWHVGERADHRTLAALASAGYDGTTHRARQFEPQWFADLDLVVAMDRGHERTLRAWAPHGHDRAKVRLMRSFDVDAVPATIDVPDPYYDGQAAFDEVLRQVEDACRGLLGEVSAALNDRSTAPG